MARVARLVERPPLRTLPILFLDSFYGGSRREFADGLVQHSRHRTDLRTLPI